MNQATFAAALLNPEALAPQNLIDPSAHPAGKRFDVYRNNVTTGLGKALEAAFPATVKLVGVSFFRAAATVFLRAYPPRNRVMMLYGDNFPAFLQGFGPAASLGYLPDVARLEQAIRESYHSADMVGVSPEVLAKIPEAVLLNARINLAPSLRLIRSPWPVHGIWQATLHNGQNPQMRAEDVLVARPEFDPTPYVLPAQGGAFMAEVMRGRPLAAALAGLTAEFDLSAMLTLLIQTHAIVGIET